jgi:hypothetical protein
MTSSTGYASSSLDAVHFGLGAADGPPSIEILWPGGAKQTVPDAAMRKVVTVTEP